MSANHYDKHPNALIHEKSPYLQQHAYNPVHWMPWSEVAFSKAQSEQKPIFLSIGYSTCHWCHVMERESFEDPEVAELLNDHFISIKVDREERPDIDHIYMAVCQELTGQGGWPLTILMTPDKKPFYAGTYFPKRAKWGRTGLLEVLSQIRDMWANDRQRILTSSDQITEAMQPHFQSHSKGELTEATLQQALDEFTNNYDEHHGGFGDAPKFPTPHNLVFLLRESKRTGNPDAKRMVEHTLQAMHAGGLYDHIGYGFARYSTDESWLVPHFEKMLYDNALLAFAYLEAFQETRNPLYARVAEEVFHYVERVMTSPEGGFYSAVDADSEGVEGKFYVWTLDELHSVLDPDDADLFAEVYDVTVNGNFEGASILNLTHKDLSEIAVDHGLTPEQLGEKLATLREKLFAVREQRVPPHKDDKILTSWNGLMIAALAKGAAVLQDPYYLHLAQRALDMIETRLVDEQGRLLARYRDGEANFLGYLDDYAFLAWGLHELYHASGDLQYLHRAGELIDEALALFWDDDNGGFYFYGSDAETLIARPKEIYDGAIPSGNSVMAYNLIRHLRLTGRENLEPFVERQLQAFSGQVNHYPAGFSFLLLALQLALGASQKLLLAEGDDVDAYAEMVAHVQQAYLPFSVTIYKGREQHEHLVTLAPAHADKSPVDGKSALYICQNFACQAPLTFAQIQDRLS
ncbi:thioredoxin domain-containing protein [Tumebacillus flagellatus]|uniref:Thioredoxin n=1 Tax=Tumebacillus flagellatus TaxID=1157490 RepID=A0A074LHY1_9BACL|nr:thioredoxin domain-containing protein [Tumebacillus flagellatus]KEO81846.1 thioredoxin [Tumebacillus flagellatus]